MNSYEKSKKTQKQDSETEFQDVRIMKALLQSAGILFNFFQAIYIAEKERQ